MTEAEKAAKEVNDNIAALKSKIEAGATKEELKNELESLRVDITKGLVSKEDYTKLEDTIKALGEDIESINRLGTR